MKRLTVGVLLVVTISLSISLLQGQEKPAGSGEIYDSAMELYYKGKYREAMERFSTLVQSFPASQLVSYSHYMIGQCFLRMEMYDEAIQRFESYIKAYPKGDRVIDSEQGLKMASEKLRLHEEIKVAKDEPSAGPSPKTKKPKRRICAQVAYLDAKNLDEVEKRVKELKEAGVDTLIFRVFQNKGEPKYKFVKSSEEEGVYFKTDHALVIEDILEKIAEIVHRNGLDLFAWMTTRYATYGKENQPEYLCKSYNFETKKMEVGRGLNLFHPSVQKRLEALFRDLGRYSIDGILFQDDLILRHNEDYSVEANRAFFKEYGYSPHPDIFYIDPYKSESGRYFVKGYTDRFWNWANWKNRWLMNVAGQLMNSAKESNPKLEFAINLYFETVLNDANGVAWFSQTFSEALKKDFDYYAVMAYHRQAMKGRNIELKESIDLMAEVAQKAVRSIENPSRVLMKVWILDWKSNEAVGFDLAPQKEMEEILTRILGQGEVSLAFVPYTHQFPLQQLKSKWTASR